MEVFFFWIGVATASLGAFGALFVIATWATNQALEFTGMAKVLLAWYGDRLTKERDARRAAA